MFDYKKDLQISNTLDKYHDSYLTTVQGKKSLHTYTTIGR
jgi:hypothetical protein